MPTQKEAGESFTEQRARARRVCSQEGEASQQMADPRGRNWPDEAKIIVKL